MYRSEKERNWTKAIAQANKRFKGVLLVVLGGETDVTGITKQDIKQVMEIVENLPKRVVQPYRSMTIQQLIECDDVPADDLVGTEAIHKHLKIYKSLFKTFLTDSKDILKKRQQMVLLQHQQRQDSVRTVQRKCVNLWVGRLNSLMDGRSGSLYCLLIPEPEEVK